MIVNALTMQKNTGHGDKPTCQLIDALPLASKNTGWLPDQVVAVRQEQPRRRMEMGDWFQTFRGKKV